MKGWQFWLGSCLLLLFSAGRAGAQGLTVISPNGGESWLGASQQTISWSYVNVDNIKIEYSLNNGLNWNLLVSNYPTSALSYNWQVPALGSTQAKVRITSSLQFIQDESNAVFTIPEPSINLNYPNGGETCATGSMQYAEWSSSGIASVVLQYSQNDGQSWQDIGTFPAGNGYANWVAPASAGAVKLRAYNVENVNKNDVSDGAVQVFAAAPANPAKYSGSPYDGYDMSSSLPDALQLVSPNGGEVLNPYTDAPIQWTFTDVNWVNLFYSTNNGSSWTAIASDVPADALQYSWSVPNTPSTNCRVKVVAADVALEDISNAKFTISDAFVQITYPNAGETFTAGTMQYIEWDYNAVATVKLEYSTDNGSSWNLIGTAPAGNKYANWVVPGSATSGMLLRIADNAVPSLYDISDLSLPWQTASPANPAKYSGSPYDGYSMDDNIPDSIRISSPNGGEIWMSSSTKTITWTYNHVDNISLEYTLNDGQSWQSIVSNIPASQLSYNWVVPTTPSNLCRIRVKDILRPAITDISDNPFIIPTGAVQITYPNGGENYGTGTMQYIEWTSTGLETVKLEYSTDNGSSWNVIGTAPAANQYANWTAPLSTSDNCLVRVSDVGNQAVYSDQSNAVFRLFSSSPANPAKYSGSPFDGYSMYHFLDEYVKVIKPNGGEIWGNGTTHQIRWATLNNNENLKIEYSTDNEASWTTLLNNVSNTPVTFNWSIAAQPSTICKLRASTMSGSEIDKSDDFFTIANTTGIITSAISGNDFCPGQTFPVSFFKTVNFNPGNRFIVQLSDSVGTFNGALENIGEVQSTSVVSIPVTIPQRFYTSNLYRLRVIATDPPTIGTDNGNNFSIRPLPLAKLGEDITLCTGSSRQLDVTNENATYLWSTGATTPSITVSAAGTFSVAVSNSCGTSRDTVKVKLLSPPTVQLGPDKQICQNSVVVLDADSGASSYLWSTGATTRRINAVLAGKYVVYATNACGTSRDSVNVTYLQAQSLELGADRGLCPGNSITLNATTSNSSYLWSTGSTAPSITITQPGTYAVNVNTQCGLLSDQVTIFNGGINLSAGADVQLCRGGTATLQATGANSYTWNTGQTGSIIQVSPQNTTTYTVTASNIYNCTATDQVQVQVLQSPTTPQVTAQGNTTFCNGDSLTLQTPVQNGFTYQWLRNGLSVSGAESASYKVRSTANYQVRVSNAGKCEATSQGIQITVNLPDTLQRDTTACGFFSWQGSNYLSDTVLVSQPQNCLVTVWNVDIQPFVTQLRDTSACGRLVLNGISYTSNAQEITDTIGCTRRGWNISIQPYIRDTTSASACGSYVWKGRTLSSTGLYADTVACSISVLRLIITPYNTNTSTASACGSYVWNGQTLTQTGIYRDTVNCQISVLDLTITPYNTNNSTASACGSYVWNGLTLTQTGFYRDTVNCQISVLDLTITPFGTDSIVVSVCGTFNWKGKTYTSSGYYSDTTSCGISVLDLTITPYNTNTSTESACGTYQWMGQTLTQTGIYRDTVNCQVSVLDLTITPYNTNNSTVSACGTYVWMGQTLSQTGIYRDTMNCQIEVLDLTITPYNTNNSTASACGTYVWMGQTLTQTGIYRDTMNCQIEVLDLTITPYSTNNSTASACGSYVWMGQTLTQTGIYRDTVNCQIEVLDLTITPYNTNNSAASACGSYVWNGLTLTQTGIYRDTLNCQISVLDLAITPFGTDSIVVSVCGTFNWKGKTYTSSGYYSDTTSCGISVLDLTITPYNTNTSTASACGTYVWMGQTLTQTGIYRDTTNCQISVLDLTITPYNTNNSTASACGSYVWMGQTLTQTGIYRDTLNCQVSVLNLTITPFSTNNSTVSACGSYVWMGQTLTQTGIYRDTVNCQIEVLDLTITPYNTNNSTASACGTYQWMGQTLTQTGIYRDTMNCQIEVLDLTITPYNTNNSTASACGTYQWMGQTLTQTGIYRDTVNCQIEVLDLTITPYNTNNSTASACGSYVWNGQTLTQTGTYRDTINCQIEVLDLTITPPPQLPIITAGGPTSFCSGGSVTLNAPAGLSYIWSNGSTNQSITVSSAGSYSVQTISGTCTSAVSQATQVTVNQTPEIGTIQILNGDTLQVNSISGLTYQWYLNGGIITGANLPYYVFGGQPGSYNVMAMSNNCLDSASILITSTQSLIQRTLSIYPNPGKDIFYVRTAGLEGSQLRVTDMLGREILRKEILLDETQVELSSMPSGTYFFRIEGNNFNKVVKVVKQ
jgi:hypothetical protein